MSYSVDIKTDSGFQTVARNCYSFEIARQNAERFCRVACNPNAIYRVKAGHAVRAAYEWNHALGQVKRIA